MRQSMMKQSDEAAYSETALRCPGCNTASMSLFYEVEQVPVHSVLLLPTREEAVAYPKGDIRLGFCGHCGFVSNVAFDPTVHEYSTRYEETQGFSPTFQEFHRDLATRLIGRYHLNGQDVIEIGCGKGEFLTMLCEIGNNRGIGFDPAYVHERNQSAVKERINFIQDFYSEKYSGYHGDFVACKMTLEHIQDTSDFMHTVRRSIGNRSDTIVFFMIPEIRRILSERAFWDIYYEHCSYFSKGSIARLFRSCGFDVLRLGTEYDDQYLTIEARPARGTPSLPLPDEEDVSILRSEIEKFTRQMQRTTEGWKEHIAELRSQGKKIVIWGGGSKGVTFFTTLSIRDQIMYAVDVNPYKHGSYMAGTGQEIVSPDFLTSYQPDAVIVMNPIYCGEIQQELDRLGVRATLIPITEH